MQGIGENKQKIDIESAATRQILDSFHFLLDILYQALKPFFICMFVRNKHF